MKPDEIILIPINTYERFLKKASDYKSIEILPDKKFPRNKIIKELDEYLSSERERLRAYGMYGINTLEKRFGLFKGMSTSIINLLFFISLILLLIGNISIANFMLATSSERIKEIGILKSLGMVDFQVFLTISNILKAL